MVKDIYLTIRCSSDLKAKAQAAAKKQNRTLSGYIINLIIEDLNKQERGPEAVEGE